MGRLDKNGSKEFSKCIIRNIQGETDYGYGTIQPMAGES